MYSQYIYSYKSDLKLISTLLLSTTVSTNSCDSSFTCGLSGSCGGSPTFNPFIPSLCLLTSSLILEVQDKSLFLLRTFLSPQDLGVTLALCHFFAAYYLPCVLPVFLQIKFIIFHTKIMVSNSECIHHPNRCSSASPAQSVSLPSSSSSCKGEVLCHFSVSVLYHFWHLSLVQGVIIFCLDYCCGFPQLVGI